jgi:hypothetical protein
LTEHEASLVELRDFLARLLALHGEGGPCVHLERYGTRSASIVALREDTVSFHYTEGPSCTHPWHMLQANRQQLERARVE